MTDARERFLDLLRLTADSGLTPNQRLILVAYKMLPDRTGTVRMTGVELAQALDLDPAAFSRLRRGLVEGGWLEQSGKLGNIRYYRLAEKATGSQVVVPLRRTAT